jgi:hypothetical protein
MDRIVARRALLAAVVVGIAGQALFVRLAIGINLVVLCALILAATALLAVVGKRRPRLDAADAWLPVVTLAVAVGTAIRSDDTLVFLDTVAAGALLAASVAALAGVAVTRRSIVAIVGIGTTVLLWAGVGILRLSELARQPGDGPARSMPAPARAIVRGVALAVPLLLLFGMLFASADAIFASLTEHLFEWKVDLGELPLRGGVAFLIAWVVAGLLSVATGIVEIRVPGEGRSPALAVDGAPPIQSLGAMVATPAPSDAVAPMPRLGVVEAVTILVAVDGLFALFVGLQVAYLFGGLDTMAAGGITYANYARRGFFELVAVTGIAGCLVVALNALVIERTRAFVAASVVLAGLAAIILASAADRLALYQAAYGWTELRFYVAATIVWLGLGIAAAVALLIRDRMRWLAHAMTFAALAVLIAITVIGPQRVVADANVARLLDPSLVPPDGRQGIDLEYVMTLGHDADPALVAAVPALSVSDRNILERDLETRWLDLGRPQHMGWPAWNLARAQAEDALRPLFDHR